MWNLGYRGAKLSGWFDVSPKNSTWDVMHEQEHCCDEAANHQLPRAAAFWITWIVSLEECSSLTQNSIRSFWSTRSVILNGTTATYYTHSTVSAAPTDCTVKSSLFTHMCSSSLSLAARLHQCRVNHSCYVKNGWTFSIRRHTIVSICYYSPSFSSLFCLWISGICVSLDIQITDSKLVTLFFSDKCNLFPQTSDIWVLALIAKYLIKIIILNKKTVPFLEEFCHIARTSRSA